VNVGKFCGLFVRRCESETTCRDIAPQHLLEAWFVEGNFSGFEHGKLARVDVDAKDFVAQLGHARRMGRPEITGTEYSHPARNRFSRAELSH
jgi:hypothetical protein